MQCPSCQEALPTEATNCPVCGSPIPAIIPTSSPYGTETRLYDEYIPFIDIAPSTTPASIDKPKSPGETEQKLPPNDGWTQPERSMAQAPALPSRRTLSAGILATRIILIALLTIEG